MDRSTTRWVKTMRGPLIGAALLAGPAPADAAVTWTKGAFAVGDVSDDGSSVSEDIVGLGCTEDTLIVHSFLVQGRTTGRGRDISDGTGHPEIVTLSIAALSGRFEPGPARLCAVAVERDQTGHPLDAIGRCTVIALD